MRKNNPFHQVFFDFYQDKFGDPYMMSWGKDGQALKLLREKITKIHMYRNNGTVPSEEELCTGFKAFLYTIEDPWVLKRFTPAIVNSKFNELVQQARDNYTNRNQSYYEQKYGKK